VPPNPPGATAAGGAGPAPTPRVTAALPARRATYRLTVPGFVALFSVLTLRAATQGSTVDPEIVALVLVTAVGLLLIGIVVPGLAVLRVRVAATSPVDVTVGDAVPVTVTLSGRADRVSVRLLEPTSPWYRTSSPTVGEIAHEAVRRGVYGQIAVEVHCRWPLGLFNAGRVHVVSLPSPVHVAPRAVRVDLTSKPRPTDASDAVQPSQGGTGDAVRSVRPYQLGDSPRLVHWPSTARAGALVVRELEPPVRTALVVVVDLRWGPSTGDGAPGPAVEAAASRAAGTVVAALRAGSEVLLSTYELDGPHIGRVSSPTEAGHRLARAMPGEPPSPPAGWPCEVIRP
jgi:uncharacterized protein (DUF58 family)